VIQLQGVCCTYGDGDVLSQLDLDIAPGSAVAFIGPNGGGKSTLMKLLAGVVSPRAGRYLFEGAEITARTLDDQVFAKRFHQRVGLLFQASEAQLFCPSVEEEVAFGPRQMALPEEEVERRTSDSLRLLGVEGLRGRVPYHLSGGEKRRVALASVLALNPDVLLLDEPMNGLDPRMKEFLRGLLVDLNRAGKTILCSTNDFRYVEGVFDTAVVMSEDHRVARVGPYGEVVADEAFLREMDVL
jgi:cobalt/nickel transport system ATP-binding protein